MQSRLVVPVTVGSRLQAADRVGGWNQPFHDLVIESDS